MQDMHGLPTDLCCFPNGLPPQISAEAKLTKMFAPENFSFHKFGIDRRRACLIRDFGDDVADCIAETVFHSPSYCPVQSRLGTRERPIVPLG